MAGLGLAEQLTLGGGQGLAQVDARLLGGADEGDHLAAGGRRIDLPFGDEHVAGAGVDEAARQATERIAAIVT